MPSEKKERAMVLEELKQETRTIIIYEAPHHLIKTLEELLENLGDRDVTICKELTKKYENAFRTTFSKALDYYRKEGPRGEYVIVVQGKSRKEIREEEIHTWEAMTVEAVSYTHLDVYKRQADSNMRFYLLWGKDSYGQKLP